jgi:hypothetical protein
MNCKITNKKIEKTTNKMELTVSYLTTPLANHRILSKLNGLATIESFSQT